MANNYLICQLYHYLFLIALVQQIPKFITIVVPDLFFLVSFFFFLVGTTNFTGEGNGSPLQYSCLEKPINRGAWWTAVHGATESQT